MALLRLLMMKRCPITYKLLPTGVSYSLEGLKCFAPQLKHLEPLPFSSSDLIAQAKLRADKLSIQGVQPKLSVRLRISAHSFELVNTGGNYILKPQNPLYEQAPENEDVTMRMAKAAGICVPFHCLLVNKDNTYVYCIKRFDRGPRSKKIAVEDFAQLSGNNRDTKYQFSMEKLIPIIEKYTTFPMLEKAELFLRTVVNYLLGNEDMHLKNFSLITNKNQVCLAPAYDFINSTIALGQVKEEIALPLNGKKNNLTRKDFIEYYAKARLLLPDKIIEKKLKMVEVAIPHWFHLIETCFLSDELKEQYVSLLGKRLRKMGMG